MRRFSADTNPGLVRDHNEDRYLANEDLGLWLVADGIGGHESGEVASAIACREIEAAVSNGLSLADAVIQGHQAVLAEIDRRGGDSNMGATVVALRIVGEEYEIAWVGDSRVYLWNGKLQQLTVDHSYVAELVEQGLISPGDAGSHPQRHIITRSLGVSASQELRVGQRSGRLEPGAKLLLCTDGLTDGVSDAEIALELRRHQSPQSQVDALMAAALAAGGRDNVTVLVVGAEAGAQTPDMDTTQDPEAAGVPATRRARWWWAGASLGLMALAVWTYLE
jgi:protein phosphatase